MPILQGELNTKVNKGLLVISLDLCSRPCNWDNRSKINGKCAYGGKYRQTSIIYEVECKKIAKCYIVTTQQTLKNRMASHFNKIQKLVTKNIRSDSFATH